MPVTYDALPAEGKKWIDEKHEKWNKNAVDGDWKGGVDAAIRDGVTPASGLAGKLGLTPAQMSDRLGPDWVEVMGTKTESDHESGVADAYALKKWRRRYLRKVTK